jgi:pimeloyl-ACP methyl ester carboxylesterase
MKLLGILFAMVLLLGACSSSTPSSTTASLGATLPKCADDQSWRCGSVTVPLDRSNPSAGTIKIAFFVQGHHDSTKPRLEPIFFSPGGPGGSVWANRVALPLLAWDRRHDTVLIEPRGVGRSGAIVCQGLQTGVSTTAELRTASADCARQLGSTADRYGTGDVALDIEDVRKALGVDSFDYYAGSYGTIAEQAYVTRFPKHVHALVLDSGFAIVNSAHDVLGIGYPKAYIRVLKLVCQRNPRCAQTYPQPQDLIDWLVRRVASIPIQGSVGGRPGPMVVDEGAVLNLLSSVGPRNDQLQLMALLDAATALKSGDQGPMLQLGNQFPLSLISGDPTDVFSNGDDAAAFCNDQTFPWDPADSFAVREKKLATAYAALPANEFAPFTTAGYAAGNPGPDYCIRWPAPTRFEPVIPAGAIYPSLPTLIMSGDEDLNAPEEINRILQTEFPGATFMVVAGAGHGSAAPWWGSCGGRAVATFFDTLRVDPSACATFAG